MSFFIVFRLFSDAARLFDVEVGSESCDGFFLGFRRAFVLEVKHCKLDGIAVWDSPVKEVNLSAAAGQLGSGGEGLLHCDGDDCAVTMDGVGCFSAVITFDMGDVVGVLKADDVGYDVHTVEGLGEEVVFSHCLPPFLPGLHSRTR